MTRTHHRYLKLLLAWLLLGVLVPVDSRLWAENWGSCNLLQPGVAARYLRRIDQVKQDSQLVYAASFHALKSLNSTFSDGGAGAEHLVSSLHYLIQHRFFEQISQMNPVQYQVLGGSSPYVKYFQMNLAMIGGEREGLEASLKIAADDASAALARYLNNPSGPEGALIRKSNAQYSPTMRYVFAGMENNIPSLKNADIKTMEQKLLAKYNSTEGIRDFIRKHLGIGIASNDIDAKLMARLQVEFNQNFGGAFYFSHEMLLYALKEIDLSSRDLNWFLDNKSSEDLRRHFIEFRTALSQPQPWSPSPFYQQVLDRDMPARISEMDRNFLRIRRHEQIRHYAESLGLLDYLPEARLILDPQARQKFEAIRRPTAIGLLDIRGLGGMNLERLHSHVDVIRSATAALLSHLRSEAELEAMGASETVLSAAKLKTKRATEHLLSLRESVLIGSDEFVQRVRRNTIAGLEKLGITEYAIWASGDDIFISIKADHINSEQLALALKSDRNLSRHVRVAILANTYQEEKVSLSDARLILGRCSDLLKTVEFMGSSDEAIVTGSLDANQALKVQMINAPDHSLRPISAEMFRHLSNSFATQGAIFR